MYPAVAAIAAEKQAQMRHLGLGVEINLVERKFKKLSKITRKILKKS